MFKFKREKKEEKRVNKKQMKEKKEKNIRQITLTEMMKESVRLDKLRMKCWSL